MDRTKIQYLIDNNILLSYKKLCEYLNEPYMNSTNSKKAQLKQWARVFECEKIKTKYKILRFRTPQELAEYELDLTYGELLEIMMCSYLHNLKDNKVIITMPKLVEVCCLWNHNYLYGKNNKDEVIELITKNKLIPLHNEEIFANDIDKFFNMTEPNYKTKLKNTLRALEDKSIIKYNKHLCLAYKEGKYTHSRRATNDEISILLTIEHSSLFKFPQRLNSDGEYVDATKSNLTYIEYLDFYNNTSRQFKQECDLMLLKKKSEISKTNITTLEPSERCAYYYYEYDIILSHDAVYDNLIKKVSMVQQSLNSKVSKNLMASSKHKKSFVDWFINMDTDINVRNLLLDLRKTNENNDKNDTIKKNDQRFLYK